ncbi:MAG: signal peptidase II [Clostridia bacterium]|nr:signal peptidase II [Clostridia bacterium]
MTVYFFIIILICVLDQLSKNWAMDFIAAANGIASDAISGGDSVSIIKGFLNFTYVENDGMSFGLLGDHRWVFMSLSTIGILAMTCYLVYLNLKGNDKLLSFALALVIGGGIGNMFDRVVLGYVVDFIDVCCFDFWVWTFNVADSAICIGAGFIVLAVIIEAVNEYKQKRAAK